jgi:ascorbate-specific PTS system EIIC-type component UlaA
MEKKYARNRRQVTRYIIGGISTIADFRIINAGGKVVTAALRKKTLFPDRAL